MSTILGDLTSGRARKALLGAVVPALVVVGAALLPDSPGGGAITAQEWIAVAVAGLSSGTVVYSVPNKAKKAAPAQDEPAATL